MPLTPTVIDMAWTWRIIAPSHLEISVVGVPGPSGASGTTNHAALSNLSFATAGHTGFAGTGVANTFTVGGQVFDPTVTGVLWKSDLNTFARYYQWISTSDPTKNIRLSGLLTNPGYSVFDIQTDIGLAEETQLRIGNGQIKALVGVFAGDGSALTDLDADNLASGTVSTARLPATIAYTNAPNTFTVGNQQITIATAANSGLTIKGAASQSGNLANFKNSADTVVAAVGPDGWGLFRGAYNETTTVSGVHLGIVSGTPRALFANGNASQNWQIDNNGNQFRWFTPGTVQMALDSSTSTLIVSGGTGRLAAKSLRTPTGNTLGLGVNATDYLTFSTAGTIGIGAGITSGTITASPQVFIRPDNQFRPALTIRGSAAGTHSANFQEWRLSNDTLVAYVDQSGNIIAAGFSGNGSGLSNLPIPSEALRNDQANNLTPGNGSGTFGFPLAGTGETGTGFSFNAGIASDSGFSGGPVYLAAGGNQTDGSVGGALSLQPGSGATGGNAILAAGAGSPGGTTIIGGPQISIAADSGSITITGAYDVGVAIQGHSSTNISVTESFDTGESTVSVGASHVSLYSSIDGYIALGGFNTLVSPPRTPSQITGDVDDYDPGIARFLRLSTDASHNITGLASGAGVDGLTCQIINVGSNNIVLVNQSGASQPQNAFLTTTGSNVTVGPNEAAGLLYDGTTGCWRVFA